MKNIITTTVLVATAFVAQADDRTITEKARDTVNVVVEKSKEAAIDTKDAVVSAAHTAERATRAAWGKTKAYVSDDMPSYREGANLHPDGLIVGYAADTDRCTCTER